MPLRLSEHPQQDRPRERFWAVGPAALTGQELLAILIGTGCAGRDALTVAGEVLGRVDGSLRRLMSDCSVGVMKAKPITSIPLAIISSVKFC